MVRFSPVFNAVAIPADTLVLVSETRTRLLRGELLFQVARRIDGIRSVHDVVLDLAGTYDRHSIKAAFAVLLGNGYLETSDSHADDARIFWGNLGDAGQQGRAEGAGDPIAIISWENFRRRRFRTTPPPRATRSVVPTFRWSSSSPTLIATPRLID